MPDPVSCHKAANDPSIIECDPVFIGPEPDPSPAAENRSSTPGVRALVAGQDAPIRVRSVVAIPVPIEVDVADIAGRCAGKTVGAILGVAGATKLHPALGVLTAFRASFDVTECAISTAYEASQRAAGARALEQCIAEGGSTPGSVNGVLTCEMPLEEE